MARDVITIDGLAGSGKTTLAHALAKRIKWPLLLSGSLYRLVALIAVRNKLDGGSVSKVVQIVKSSSLELRIDANGSPLAFLDGINVEDQIRTPEISEMTSILAAHRSVRESLIDAQRLAYQEHNLIAEGRDMGTVVFPDARLKFFVQVPEEIRIERRLKDIVSKSGKLEDQELKSLKEKMKMEIIERDKRDLEREHSPTIAAKEAILIDNSVQTLTKVVENMYDLAARRGLT